MKKWTLVALPLALTAFMAWPAAATDEGPTRPAEKRVIESGDPDLPEGTNKILGTQAADSLQGTDESDVIEGEGGDDQINGGEGNDELGGGDGDDHIQGSGGNDKINGGPGNDRINGGDGDDTIRGGDGNDHVNAGDGDDRIYGGDGNDILEANPGKDIIEAGSGDDILIGGEDADSMMGNEGADTFIWLLDHVGDAPDVIKDFQPAQGDKLDFTELLAGRGYKGDGSLASVKNRLRAKDDTIEFDPSGTGNAFAPLVVLEGHKPDLAGLLKSGNLVLVGGGKKGD